MSKTYKGYELYKMIVEGNIKQGTKLKDLSNCETVVFDGENFVYEIKADYLSNMYDDIIFATLDFELIEDEIDIQSIEECDIPINMKEIDHMLIDMQDKINELVEAVKQLDRNKEDKQNGQK